MRMITTKIISILLTKTFQYCPVHNKKTFQLDAYHPLVNFMLLYAPNISTDEGARVNNFEQMLLMRGAGDFLYS